MPSITRPGPASAICRSRSTSCCRETSVGEELVLPVSWQTPHASFLGRVAVRCRLAHNLINRSGGGTFLGEKNEWRAQSNWNWCQESQHTSSDEEGDNHVTASNE